MYTNDYKLLFLFLALATAFVTMKALADFIVKMLREARKAFKLLLRIAFIFFLAALVVAPNEMGILLGAVIDLLGYLFQGGVRILKILAAGP